MAVTYHIQVLDWEWHCYFGIGRSSRPGPVPMLDNRSIEIKGALLSPQHPKIQDVRLSFRPELMFNPASLLERTKWPTDIGNMEVWKGVLQCSVYMPSEAADGMLTTLAAGRFRFAQLYAEKLYRRNAPIFGFSIQAKLDPEDARDAGIPLE